MEVPYQAWGCICSQRCRKLRTASCTIPSALARPTLQRRQHLRLPCHFTTCLSRLKALTCSASRCRLEQASRGRSSPPRPAPRSTPWQHVSTIHLSWRTFHACQCCLQVHSIIVARDTCLLRLRCCYHLKGATVVADVTGGRSAWLLALQFATYTRAASRYRQVYRGIQKQAKETKHLFSGTHVPLWST